MPVLVRIPTPLRRLTGGAGDVYAKGKDIGELVDDLERQFPGLGSGSATRRATSGSSSTST